MVLLTAFATALCMLAYIFNKDNILGKINLALVPFNALLCLYHIAQTIN